jgi:hypothetical protein
MINDSPQPIFSYLDQLISESWSNWTENILTQIPEDTFRVSNGFQLSIGAVTAAERTRAVECHRLSLLSNRLVAPQEGARGEMPSGWEEVFNGRPPISRLGYLSSILGKSLKLGCENRKVLEAVDVVGFLSSLGLGVRIDGNSVSSILIFQYVVDCVETHVGADAYNAFREELLRWIAGAVFCTIETDATSKQLLDDYKKQNPNPTLVFRLQEGPDMYPASLDDVYNAASGNPTSLPGKQEWLRHKAALFWSAEPRGLYQLANRAGKDFLKLLVVEDVLSFHVCGLSLLETLLDPPNPESFDLIEVAAKIFNERYECKKKWSNMMKKLYEGVFEALQFVGNEIEDNSSRVIYFPHHLIGDVGEGENQLSVAIDGVPVLPRVDDVIAIGESKYLISEISSGKDLITLTIGRQSF